MIPTIQLNYAGAPMLAQPVNWALFKITSEQPWQPVSAVGIEAVAGKQAEDYVNEQFKLIDSLRGNIEKPQKIFNELLRI